MTWTKYPSLRVCSTSIHPPSPSQPTPLNLQERLESLFEVDSWTLLETAKEGMEGAFWGFLMPSISGIKGIGQMIGKSVVFFTHFDHSHSDSLLTRVPPDVSLVLMPA